MVADAHGEGTELPEAMDDDAYERFLAAEGLGAERGGGRLAWVVVAVLAGLGILALASLARGA
jgi:hypothetical protein